ncbi:2-polyprenyl-6-methoxyphenol hydroxylase-like oxidoreductase [Kribbella pittospori]|uniref:2-polyprenyl-6-methoxyphenol hydroxylase-like oxidoreductase n=1 Tax=Kribbella pittospori TaxID=722689 RepID=A0A4R0LAS9_9ACTN|nr:FAD-dependent monooxygenase [Kribbella pittospori]TCC66055.1 2-polyprenyl-6-methoxyphenol hydroxylase-like oxidoreductase [Kribbella pittospori]
MNDDRLGHAVVIGGSMAGILTARVLSDRFDQVTIIERDRLPDGPEVRKGVPQTRHLHAFWAGGMEVVERLLPGVGNDLIAAGAVPLGLPTEMAWLTPSGRWSQAFPASQRIVSSTRALLEWTVRSHVEKLTNLRFFTEHEVTGLNVRPPGELAGLRLRDRRSGATAELPADLVVDASGRGSRLPEWLEDAGFAAPEESTIDSFLGYATRMFEIPAGFSARWNAVYLQPAPPVHSRGGIMFPIEGNRWVLTLIGGGGDYPPTDEQGFRDFAASLRSSLLSEVIEVAEPASPIWGYRRTSNRRRHYEKLAMPGRLLVIGDSLCAFNPSYGQGMTVAAKEAELLTGILEDCRSSADLPRALEGAQAVIATRVKGSWMLATGSDLRYPTTVGATQTRMDKVVNKYLDRVLAAVPVDPTVSAAFLRVLNLIDEPQALFSPRLMPRVLRTRRRLPAVPKDFVVDRELSSTERRP